MTKVIDAEKMIKRVFTVAEILAQYQNDAKNSEQAQKMYLSSHTEKHQTMSEKNTNP